MKKILILEDDENVALALCARLKTQIHATWLAGDGISGLGQAIRAMPDLIIMDIALPGANGLDMAENLRHLPETRNTPIIFSTTSTDPRLRQRAIERGAVGLLLKPYDAEALLAVVKYALARPAWSRPITLHETQDYPGAPTKRAVKKILIVEDDQKVALALSVRMKAAGYEPIVAYDALSGLRSAVNSKPDLVVLDISLPAGDGFSVAERIQANISSPIPIIFLTASKRLDFRERAFELGAVGFFEKPYEAEGLLAAVRHATA
jgi:DNA-binding response OmpR family regulator